MKKSLIVTLTPLICTLFGILPANANNNIDLASVARSISSMPLAYTQNSDQWLDNILYWTNAGANSEDKYGISTSRPNSGSIQPNSEIAQDALLKRSLDGKSYICGDANGSNTITIMDESFIVNYIFNNGSAPTEYLAANADGCSGPDTTVNISDAGAILAFLYEGGPSPSGCAGTAENWSSPAGYEIRVAAPPFTPYPGGDSVAIPIYITNAANIEALTAGFQYTSPEGYKITSVDWTGSVFSPNLSRNTKFDTLQSLALVGGIYYMGQSLSSQNDALLAKLNARAIGLGGTGDITLEKAFVRPAGEFIFVSSGSMIVPAINYSIDPNEVTNLNNAGTGSLRAAIINANTNLGIDTIYFSISGTINLTTQLPAIIDDSCIILGSTAPGEAHSVIIDGSGLSACNGLAVQSCNNKIEGLAIRNFPGCGIEVSGALSVNNTLTNNIIYNNAGLAIDLNNDGVTLNDLGDLDTGPNNLLNYPVKDTSYMAPDSNFIFIGHAADSSIVEFYLAHPNGQPSKPEDPSGHGEAYTYIGSDTCDETGGFDYIISKSFGNFSRVSAIAIDTFGNTSEFSDNLTLTPSPLIIVAYSPVNLWITDPDGYFIGKDALGNLSQTITTASYDELINDSVTIYNPIQGRYEIVVIPEADAPADARYGIGIRIDGSDEAAIIVNALVPPADSADTLSYFVQEGWQFINGDANRSGVINALDVTYLINFLYKHGPAPNPAVAGDANCNGVINALDVTRLINFLYKHGLAPCQL